MISTSLPTYTNQRTGVCHNLNPAHSGKSSQWIRSACNLFMFPKRMNPLRMSSLQLKLERAIPHSVWWSAWKSFKNLQWNKQKRLGTWAHMMNVFSVSCSELHWCCNNFEWLFWDASWRKGLRKLKNVWKIRHIWIYNLEGRKVHAISLYSLRE